MATDLQADVQGIVKRPRAYRLNVKQYLAMASAGILPGDTRFELLDGLVVKQMTQNPPHSSTVGRLGRCFNALLTDDWLVNEDKPVQLDPHWLPVPDVTILVGPDRRYDSIMPTAADVGLIIEVSDTTYATDRGYKRRKYADIGIPIYWITNLAKRQVEVYRQPRGKGVDAAYGSVEVYGNDAAVPVVLADQEVGRINVADLLPSTPAQGA